MDTVEKIATRVIILRSGRVVADDSVERLRDLTQQVSLENVFAKLAVEDDVDGLAENLLDAMQL